MKKLSVLLLMLVAVLATVGVAAAAKSNYVAHLASRNEIPPVGVVVESLAQGQAIYQLSEDGTALHYKLIVANIENVVAAHIHLGSSDVNGPVVAFLYGPVAPGGGRTGGALAEGTITAANLIGPLAGQPLSALIAAIEAGNAYTNVHTNDGIAPTNTGAGDFPGGEIRGQIH